MFCFGQGKSFTETNFLFRKAPLRWLPTVTVQLNIDQSLREDNDFTFCFLMLNKSSKGMKTSFVFVSQEIRQQKLF